MSKKLTLRLIKAAYDLGWRHACDDHNTQRFEAGHPIGQSKARDARSVAAALDPHDLLGLGGYR